VAQAKRFGSHPVSARSAPFVVLGAGGFIGTALVAWLESRDHRVHAVTRAAVPALLAARQPCGHVIDCIGLNGHFRSRPIDAAKAHVGVVARCLSELRFESFLLLSSTRVYRHACATHEDTALPSLPADPADLYNLTKLAGEALCLSDRRPAVRVVRLSNVHGPGMPAETVLGAALRDGLPTGSVVFHQGPGSTRDYVSIASVVRLLPAIATVGQDRIYNVAAGSNTSHATIADRLRKDLGWQVRFVAEAPTVRLLPIDTSRLDAEFGPASGNLTDDLTSLLTLDQESQCSPLTRPAAA
jgi:nucleoside-diphosphate-sugar epimerase